MFSRSRNPLLAFLRSYRIWVTSIIKINFRFKRFSASQWCGWFCHMNFHNFSSIYVFEVKLFIAGLPTKLPCLGDFEYLWQPSVHELISMSDFENLRTGSCLGFSRSPRHTSSVGMLAIVSLTSKTWILKKLWKSIRQNHQYLWDPLEPEVDLDFRGYSNMLAY